MLESIISAFVAGGITSASLVIALKWIIKKIITGKIDLHNSKLLAEFNDLLEKQNKFLDIELNQKNHVWEKQYDIEFENYVNIWDVLQKYIKASLALRDMSEKPQFSYEEQNNIYRENENEWQKCMRDFKAIIEGKAPFYKKCFYEKFKEINTLCEELHDYYQGKNYSVLVDSDYVLDKKGKIEELQEEILDDLRKYLDSLNVLSSNS